MTGASCAEHVRHAATQEANCPAEAPEPGGIGNRRAGPGNVLDLHEVRANGSDSLEIQGDLAHRMVGDGRATASIEILGQKDVFGRLHGVLEQAMDEDHVHADEIPSSLDGLGRNLADVRYELQLQAARLRATGAGAHVEFDQPPLDVEGKRKQRVTVSAEDTFEPAWSPDGKTIAYSEGGAIYVTDAAGKAAKRITDETNNDSSPAWSPVPAPTG